MMKSLIKKFIPKFLLHWYHLLWAFLGVLSNGFPSRKLIIIGVTGTKGKSSVVEMCHKIFQEAGFSVASLSTVRFKINDNERRNTLKMTMPGRTRLQDFLGKAALEQCKYAVLEVSSEGISQSRHKFINFNTAVFTNLEPEHIESHGSFEKYREAKGKLFQVAKKIHIVSLDDENAEYFLGIPAEIIYGFTIKLHDADLSKYKEIKNLKIIKAENVQAGEDGSSFVANGIKISLKLPGEFNVYNVLAAICVALSEGISLEVCRSALEKITEIYGRMNLVIREPFKVFIDYAHTPNSLEKVYQTFQSKRLVCVLGSAGGGRDKWKRPLMGEIAGKYCQEIIITNEDPYDENPEEIIDQVASGISTDPQNLYKSAVYKIVDRQEAINKSLSLAKEGNVVLITGKGREPWMCVADGKKIAWDDKKIVEEEYAKLCIKTI